jgi:hypothetical protein
MKTTDKIKYPNIKVKIILLMLHDENKVGGESFQSLHPLGLV